MKLCTFELDTPLGPSRRIGVITPSDRILDLNLAYALMLAERDNHPRAYELAAILTPPDMLEFVRNGQHGRQAADETLAYLGLKIDDEALTGAKGEHIVHSINSARLLAPLPQPLSIRDTLGFLDHLKAARGPDIPEVFLEIPALYYKGNTMSVQGTDSDVIWPVFSERLDYELEFAAVIGRQGTNIPLEETWNYIAGYMIFNDVSARDIQSREMTSRLGPNKGKDFDTGNVFGPYLVTPDEFDPRDDNTMVARVNGEEWSRGSTNMMDHNFAAIINYLSQGMTLHPGDIICSGTVPSGCGLELKHFPKPGDTIELEIDGLGVLRNRFVKP
jgi:2-keto-4-pentenoate hydratase/2-oxohepta-3-ene-1,7-dioic acid hydratase in catechol pathway